ncbi:hypothetical protein SNOG_13455 [Parastagonospora nodorum SN15]|uniref:Uncharacterized protein n=1 Tax=Phaeosphaeria nodorum (strain SN15 / ATCC MYA-4574 / FGSC 10173) TaxID=321614 RepID=Q0U459_PHANO|nr:hypothetical protein SNOG_13455 [Parastagonospora nodorum SN15]EAT79339.1 hypothetical protein SNOG_13455 [Parastagonospora nodorum SN15]
MAEAFEYALLCLILTTCLDNSVSLREQCYQG